MKEKNDSQKPNILLIIFDTLRSDHLGCYGYSKPTSPNIDAVATSGVLFENAFSAAPWTLPSHGSIFTGTYPFVHGADRGKEDISDDLVTMARFLKNHGYFTVGISSNVWINQTTRLTHGFELFRYVNEIPFRTTKDPNLMQKAIREFYWRYIFKRYDYGASKVNRFAERVLKNHKKQDRPFFIFVNYLETHLRYEPPAKYTRMFLDESERKKAALINQDARDYNAGVIDMNLEDFSILKALYDAEIRYVDYRFGQLVNLLKKLGHYDNTLIILTSDHGENIGEHNLMDHQFSLHDTVIKVPMILRYPKLLKPRREKPLVQTIDILPTLAELIGVEPGAKLLNQLQGMSILDGCKIPEDRYVLSQYPVPHTKVLERLAPKYDWNHLNRRLDCIRNNRYKFIRASDGGHMLFDLERDREELRNIYSSDNNVAKKMLEKLDSLLPKNASLDTNQSVEYEGDMAIQRILHGLGYL